jgi:putative ABC transport system ATP-binding protein
MQIILDIQNLSKTHKSGDKQLTVLNDVTLQLESGTTCAIVGPSGSGKTTLLGLAAGLDLPSSGSVALNGINLESLTEDDRASLRNKLVGFIFQNFQLIPTLTALENIMVPMELRGNGRVQDDARHLLERVGLADRAHHYPIQLSGGEQQRVALARAFINRPKILFADEPTGNLDTGTGKRISELLFELNRENGTTLVMATHDHELAERNNKIIRLRNGLVVG